ncbi:MAG: hypothetical protein IPK19_39475 [Chloroflexi bacterium]|nr:hypothetical protein [Chloroflexota bacterium]
MISGVTGDGIENLGTGTIIQGNIIGANAAQTAAIGNSNGIVLECAATVVGGNLGSAASNVIGGNLHNGIVGICGMSLPGHTIYGNTIGVNAARTVALGNGWNGISALSGHIGDSPSSKGNIIQNNGSSGIANPYLDTDIFYNTIGGTLADGVTPAGNGRHGIEVGVNQVRIANNNIAYNGWDGIRDEDYAADVRNNAIYHNGQLGIDIGADGVRANTPDSAYNYPIITQVAKLEDTVHITGTVNSTANSSITIYVFGNSACDPSGYGEGEAYLKTVNVSTDASGNASFAVELPGTTWSAFALTQRLDAHSSEFSQCKSLPTPAATFNVTNTNHSGAGSLRAAITSANATAAPDRIEFHIPGSGVHTITPLSPLPAIVYPVIMTGETEEGWTAATDTTPAVLRVELDGSAILDDFEECLEFEGTSSGSIVRGLIINRWGTGIKTYSDFNHFAGNHFGVSADGLSLQANVNRSILLANGHKNLIGGSTPAERNVISGTALQGVEVWINASDSRIIGNYIGTDVTGMQPIENGAAGVYIGGSANTDIADNVISGNGLVGIAVHDAINTSISGNLIGLTADGLALMAPGASGFNNYYGIHEVSSTGTQILDGNVIGGADQAGLVITGGVDTVVSGNLIGVLADGVTPAGNGAEGVLVEDGENISIYYGNVIANNGGDGIRDVQGITNIFDFNNIYSNGGLGIDILADGVRTNVPFSRLNAPTISSVSVIADKYVISGSLMSAANETLVIQFYANTTCDPSGHGEGEDALNGIVTPITDALGSATFSGIAIWRSGQRRYITATAWAPAAASGTSEFSACYEVPYTDATLNGGVTLQSASTTNVPVRVRVAPTLGGAAIVDETVLLNSHGVFSLHWIKAGTYHIWVKGENTLSSSAPNTVLVNGVNNVTIPTLRGGNANGDTIVNISDFSILAAAFGTVPDGAAWDARADFNRDNVVNISDFSILASSFGQTDSTQGAP